MYYILYMYMIYIIYIIYIDIWTYICRYMTGRYIDAYSKYHDCLLSKTLTDSYYGILKNENEYKFI